VIANNVVDTVASGNGILIAESMAGIVDGHVICSGNTVSNVAGFASSLGKGIVVNGNPLTTIIANNSVSCDAQPIYITLTSSGYSNVHIHGNVLKTSNICQAVISRIGSAPLFMSVKDNTIAYIGVAVKTTSLIALDVVFGTLEIEGNFYDNFHTSTRIIGVTSGRHDTKVRIRNNHHYNGTNGYTYTDTASAGDTAMIPVLGDTFDTITTPTPLKTSRNVVYFQAARRGGTRFEIEDTATPIWGQWLVGDAVLKTDAGTTGVTHWLCTTAGSPGVFTAITNAAFSTGQAVALSYNKAWI
jgi:hypothetical protein